MKEVGEKRNHRKLWAGLAVIVIAVGLVGGWAWKRHNEIHLTEAQLEALRNIKIPHMMKVCWSGTEHLSVTVHATLNDEAQTTHNLPSSDCVDGNLDEGEYFSQRFTATSSTRADLRCQLFEDNRLVEQSTDRGLNLEVTCSRYVGG